MGPDVDKIFEVPKNHLKSIAIGPGTLISHFGIIKETSCHEGLASFS